LKVVAGYGRGGEEEAAPVEGGERRRSPSGVRFRAMGVAQGARHGRLSDDARASGAGGRR
jgi:hypothetical protein